MGNMHCTRVGFSVDAQFFINDPLYAGVSREQADRYNWEEYADAVRAQMNFQLAKQDMQLSGKCLFTFGNLTLSEQEANKLADEALDQATKSIDVADYDNSWFLEHEMGDMYENCSHMPEVSLENDSRGKWEGMSYLLVDTGDIPDPDILTVHTVRNRIGKTGDIEYLVDYDVIREADYEDRILAVRARVEDVVKHDRMIREADPDEAAKLFPDFGQDSKVSHVVVVDAIPPTTVYHQNLDDGGYCNCTAEAVIWCGQYFSPCLISHDITVIKRHFSARIGNTEIEKDTVYVGKGSMSKADIVGYVRAVSLNEPYSLKEEEDTDHDERL